MGYLGYKPADKPLTSADITDSIITSAKITDGTIANADIANSTINLTTKVTGSLPVANGGTGLTALGTSLQVLRTNTGATALEYATLSTGASAGQVIQVVQTFKNNSFTSSSTSFVDITDLSVAITPSSASNKILVLIAISASASDDALFQLLRGATVIGSSTGQTNNAFAYISSTFTNTAIPIGIHFLDSPATTSATTYKIQGKCYAGGNQFVLNKRNGDSTFGASSTLTVMEIKG